MILRVIHTINPVPYSLAYKRQKHIHAERVAGVIPDTIWLLEHPPVITTGLRSNQVTNIHTNLCPQEIDIISTERGGSITYHGPGQLVGYLFISMENRQFQVKRFVQDIETGFITFLRKNYGIIAHHDDKYTGVWVGMDKIAAIGIALSQRVTLHGFAFNVNTDLSHFKWIIPCGITDKARGVTSLEKLTGKRQDMSRIILAVNHELRTALGYESGDVLREEAFYSMGTSKNQL
ncbi:MAG: hypothetical protein B0D92_08160 [Spirochaeta sp. LUC14_002_19_P3]|nr:MAG: hypothetical protein B0D92_08160 [Spirochaeta sp. LUC14_002_19_P3]